MWWNQLLSQRMTSPWKANILHWNKKQECSAATLFKSSLQHSPVCVCERETDRCDRLNGSDEIFPPVHRTCDTAFAAHCLTEGLPLAPLSQKRASRAQVSPSRSGSKQTVATTGGLQTLHSRYAGAWMFHLATRSCSSESRSQKGSGRRRGRADWNRTHAARLRLPEINLSRL